MGLCRRSLLCEVPPHLKIWPLRAESSRERPLKAETIEVQAQTLGTYWSEHWHLEAAYHSILINYRYK